MTLADAGADAGPLWLRVSIALGPSALAALIAGYFALSNTVNRRAERLKNLNEIRVSSSTESINRNYALERIILREVVALDRATTPVFKWEKRLVIMAILAAPFVWAYLLNIWWLHIIAPPHFGKMIRLTLIAILAIIVVGCCIGWFLTNKTDVLEEGYSQWFAALDERAAQAPKSADQSDEQDSRKSESTLEIGTKNQQAANSTPEVEKAYQLDSTRRLSSANILALAVGAISGFVIGRKSGEHWKPLSER